MRSIVRSWMSWIIAVCVFGIAESANAIANTWSINISVGVGHHFTKNGGSAVGVSGIDGAVWSSGSAFCEIVDDSGPHDLTDFSSARVTTPNPFVSGIGATNRNIFCNPYSNAAGVDLSNPFTNTIIPGPGMPNVSGGNGLGLSLAYQQTQIECSPPVRRFVGHITAVAGFTAQYSLAEPLDSVVTVSVDLNESSNDCNSAPLPGGQSLRTFIIVQQGDNVHIMSAGGQPGTTPLFNGFDSFGQVLPETTYSALKDISDPVIAGVVRISICAVIGGISSADIDEDGINTCADVVAFQDAIQNGLLDPMRPATFDSVLYNRLVRLVDYDVDGKLDWQDLKVLFLFINEVAPQPCVAGDDNADGVANWCDLNTLRTLIAGGSVLSSDPSYTILLDMNLDGVLDSADDSLLFAVVRCSCIGDANQDGLVDFADTTTVVAHWLETGSSWIIGDADGSGTVDFADITAVIANFGIPCCQTP